MTLLEKFNSKYSIDENGCWIWGGSLRGQGYAQIYDGKKNTIGSRVSYALFKGPIPNGMHVLHKCDVRKCVNPEHLFLGTHQDNMIDKTKKGRSTNQNAIKNFCLNGHEFTQENTRIYKNGKRCCITCQNIRSKIRYKKLKKEKQ